MGTRGVDDLHGCVSAGQRGFIGWTRGRCLPVTLARGYFQRVDRPKPMMMKPKPIAMFHSPMLPIG